MFDYENITSSERNIDLYHHIDPGFINYRKCYSIFGSNFINNFESFKKPNSENDHWAKLLNDHLLVDLALQFCKANKVRTLGEIILSKKGLENAIFCSTESLKGNKKVYSEERVKNSILFPIKIPQKVYLEFSVRHFIADTGKMDQSAPRVMSIIGQIRNHTDTEIIIHPIIMGAPTFDSYFNKDVPLDPTFVAFQGWNWFLTFPEDIDEFSQIKNTPQIAVEEWTSYMKNHEESVIKQKLSEVLNVIPSKDWGGEINDLFVSNIHLSGVRKTAAFLLKGPAGGKKFKPMKPTFLGKNGDQIFRLAQSPADILIVQHCHEIEESVRATLRAFSAAPHNPRRYCLIDGQDTYRILKTYNKL